MRATDCVHHEERDNVVSASWRWYFPVRALPWALPNGEAFHDLLLKLKQQDHEFSQLYFGFWLSELIDKTFGNPEAIVVVPPSAAYHEGPVYPLVRVAQVAERLSSATFLQNALIRKHPVRKSAFDASARDYGMQFDSMEADRTSLSGIDSVIVVDDITTSGTTMEAAKNLILNCNPTISITAFTFGKTKQRGSTPFPEDPEFPVDPPARTAVQALTMAIEVKLESQTKDEEHSPDFSNSPGLAEINGLPANEREQSDIELSSNYDALPRSADAPSGAVEGWSVELAKIYSDTLATARTTLTELVVREDYWGGAKRQVFDGAGHLILECFLEPSDIALIQYSYSTGLLTEKRCYGPTGALAMSKSHSQLKLSGLRELL